MKKQSFMMKSAFIAAAIVCAVSTTVPALALNNDKKSEAVLPVEVKYVDGTNLNRVFQVNIKNVQEDDITFVLKDENGNSLYTERITGKAFSKKFRFADQQLNDTKVSVVLYGKKANTTQVFQITPTVSVVEGVEVTRVM